MIDYQQYRTVWFVGLVTKGIKTFFINISKESDPPVL